MTRARPLHPCPEGFLGCDPIQGQCLGFCDSAADARAAETEWRAAPVNSPQIEFAGPEPIRWRIAALVAFVVAITILFFWRLA